MLKASAEIRVAASSDEDAFLLCLLLAQFLRELKLDASIASDKDEQFPGSTHFEAQLAGAAVPGLVTTYQTENRSIVLRAIPVAAMFECAVTAKRPTEPPVAAISGLVWLNQLGLSMEQLAEIYRILDGNEPITADDEVDSALVEREQELSRYFEEQGVPWRFRVVAQKTITGYRFLLAYVPREEEGEASV